MTYIWFWVQWLAERSPKLPKYQFTEFCRLTARNRSEGAKIILKILFLTRGRDLRKNQRAPLSKRENLAEHAPKSVKYQFTKFGRLAERNFSEGAKTILKLLFLTRRRVLRRSQRALSNREKLLK